MSTPDIYYLVEWFGDDDEPDCRDFTELSDAKEFWENGGNADATLYRVVSGNREFLA